MMFRRRSNSPTSSNPASSSPPAPRLRSAPVPSASAPDALSAAQPTPLPGIDPAGYTAEAERFAATMSNKSPTLYLDFTIESIDRLDTFMTKMTALPSDGYALGLGCYLGEVIRRNQGGTWLADGTLTNVGNLTETFPLQRARYRWERTNSQEPPELLHDYLKDVLNSATNKYEKRRTNDESS